MIDTLERAVERILDTTTAKLTTAEVHDQLRQGKPRRAWRPRWLVALVLHRLCWQGFIKYEAGAWRHVEYSFPKRDEESARFYREKVRTSANRGGTLPKVERDEDAAAIIAELFCRADEDVSIRADELPDRIYGTADVLEAAADYLKKYPGAKLRVLAHRFVYRSAFFRTLDTRFPRRIELKLLSDKAWHESSITFVLADYKSLFCRASETTRWPFAQFTNVNGTSARLARLFEESFASARDQVTH